jgi:hypothetical protein
MSKNAGGDGAMKAGYRAMFGGRAGELSVMSEFLEVGWQVAQPLIDFGDDFYLLDDEGQSIWRVQVKRSSLKRLITRDAWIGQFRLSREQLEQEKAVELLYVFAGRRVDTALPVLVPPAFPLTESCPRWEYFIMPRHELLCYVNAGLGRRRDNGRIDLSLTFEKLVVRSGEMSWARRVG